MNSRLGPCCLAILCVVVCLSTGCGDSGPPIGLVTGTVTLDGKPVDQASIAFYPADGRASMGSTDAEGKYELVYTADRQGAVIGEHKVTISTEIDEEVEYGDSDYENDEKGEVAESVVSESRKESMPPRYRDSRKTELTATVTKGQNTIDFALTSE